MAGGGAVASAADASPNAMGSFSGTGYVTFEAEADAAAVFTAQQNAEPEYGPGYGYCTELYHVTYKYSDYNYEVTAYVQLLDLVVNPGLDR